MEVYFDNSATTRPYDEVIDAVSDTMKNFYGNPSSAHRLGIEAEKRLNEARDIVAGTLNCSRDEVIFTSGGSESNNFFLKAFAKPGGNIITTNIEHPSVLYTCRELEKQDVKITYLKVDGHGRINLNELSDNIGKDTLLVSVMHVNNETGITQDIEKIGRIIKDKSSRAKFHVDAVQSFCKAEIDVNRFKIDLLSASGHKIHGPRGAGAAYIRKGLSPKPLITGGGQEKNIRSGTENLPGIWGMAKACEIMSKNINANYTIVSEIKQYFINRLNHFDNIIINSPMEKDFLPYILSVTFRGIKGEVLLHLLEDSGIYVSTGSACSARKNSESYVLGSINLCKSDINSTIRFSFNEQNTKDEVDYTSEELEKALKFLRRVNK